MKANELRIGNYILHEPTIDDWEEIIVTLHSLLQIDISTESYFGIPLTEEWLVKFGFEKISEFKYIIDDNYLTLCVEDEEWDMVCVDVFIKTSDMEIPFYITPIEYVHQLQNLYFALTSEELTIKE